MPALQIDPHLRVGRIGHDHVLALVAVQVSDVERPAALRSLRQREERQPAALVGLVGARLIEREHPRPAQLALQHQDLRAPLAVDLAESNRMRHVHGKALLGPQFLLIGREPDVDRVVAFGVDDHDVLRLVAVDVDGLDQPGRGRRMRHALGLGEHAGGRLIDEGELLVAQHHQVVPAVLVEVTHRQCARFRSPGRRWRPSWNRRTRPCRH